MTHFRGLLVALSCLPSALMGQDGEWPTLSDAGIEYLSQSGFFQVSLSGQLDLETLHVRESRAGLVSREAGEAPLTADREPCAVCHVGMGLRGGGGALQVYRLRMFADIFLGDHIYSLIEGRSNAGTHPRTVARLRAWSKPTYGSRTNWAPLAFKPAGSPAPSDPIPCAI